MFFHRQLSTETAPFTVVGTPTISTATKKTGAGSLSVDGTSGNVDGIIYRDTVTASTNFTIEAWIYVPSANKATASDDAYAVYVDGYGVYIDYQSTGFDNFFAVGPGIGAENLTLQSYDTWHHVGIMSDGSDYYGLMNGTLINNTPTSPSGFVNALVTVGLRGDDYENGIRGFTGFIDQVRVSNTTRYTSNFTPPTTEFVDDANTVFLAHYNTDFNRED